MTAIRPIRAIIQSRMSSSRLPGKALLPVANRPMVVLSAQRLCGRGVQAAVATSTEPTDDAIAAAAEAAGLRCFRGSLDDTLDRFLVATADLPDDALVARMTADNVVPDAGLVLELAAVMRAKSVRYIRTGGIGAPIPYGVAAEVFEVSLLRESVPHASSTADREHVTPAIRRLVGDCQIDPDRIGPDWGRLRCTVDNLHDYDRVWRLFAKVDDPVRIGWRELCERLEPPPARLPIRRPNPIGQTPMLLGTVQLGLRYGAANVHGLPSHTEAMQTLRTAAEVGISHLDTARAYGLSEARIGSALAGGLSERLAVVTKLRPLDALPADADPQWVGSAFDLSVAESLLALKSTSVDALLLHRAADLRRGAGVIGDRLRELRSCGVARLTGVSVQDREELMAVLADPECGYLQLPFNLLDDRLLDDDVQAALRERRDLVVTARSVYLQGLLLGGDQTVQTQWPQVPGLDEAGVRRIRAGVADLVGSLNRRSAADLCLAYALGHDWVTSVVLGAETPEQVRESAELAALPPLTAQQCRQVRETLHPVPRALLDPSRWG